MTASTPVAILDCEMTLGWKLPVIMVNKVKELGPLMIDLPLRASVFLFVNGGVWLHDLSSGSHVLPACLLCVEHH